MPMRPPQWPSSGPATAAATAIALLSLLALSPAARAAGPAPAPSSAAPAEVWTNSLGMPFVRIPAGSFRMGSD
ncbi:MULTISPECIES: hypothetical protein [Paracidovorax]|uniref:hypothetical protein n=1 Tax=Paracidovorax TaxID=3051137 RepID=UPI00030ECE3A|nr:hypothetical protein [Paracidovorax avenae]